MSEILWPSDLPALVQVQNYKDSLAETRIRTEMDAGPVKTRRRFTAGVEKVTVSIRCNRTQVARFKIFFNVDTAGGSLAWNWVDALSQEPIELMFGENPPDITPINQMAFLITFPLEIQP